MNEKYIALKNMLKSGLPPLSLFPSFPHSSHLFVVCLSTRLSEGMQTMCILGRNTAWLLKCIDAGKQAGIVPPPFEAQTNTNFIR